MHTYERGEIKNEGRSRRETGVEANTGRARTKAEEEKEILHRPQKDKEREDRIGLR